MVERLKRKHTRDYVEHFLGVLNLSGKRVAAQTIFWSTHLQDGHLLRKSFYYYFVCAEIHPGKIINIPNEFVACVYVKVGAVFIVEAFLGEQSSDYPLVIYVLTKYFQ